MRIHPNRAAKPPCLDGPYQKRSKAPHRPLGATVFHIRPVPFSIAKPCGAHRLTLSDCGRRKDSAKAVVDSTPGDSSLQGHAAPAVVLPPNGDSHPAARPVTSPVMDAYFRSWPSCARQHLLLRCPAATYPLGRIFRQPAPVSFSCV